MLVHHILMMCGGNYVPQFSSLLNADYRRRISIRVVVVMRRAWMKAVLHTVIQFSHISNQIEMREHDVKSSKLVFVSFQRYDINEI